MTSTPSSTYRDLSSLTRWTKGLIAAQLVAAGVGIFVGLQEHQMLTLVARGTLYTESEVTQASQSNDLRLLIVGSAQILIYIVGAIFFLKWIYHSDQNVHYFGANDLQFRPGWCVGWYFIPIANLWKPYQAMKEIWRASKNPDEWQSQSASGTLSGWWALWILSIFIGNAATRLNLQAQELDDYFLANRVMILSDIIEIALCALVIMLINEIARFQHQTYQQQQTKVEANS